MLQLIKYFLSISPFILDMFDNTRACTPVETSSVESEDVEVLKQVMCYLIDLKSFGTEMYV